LGFYGAKVAAGGEGGDGEIIVCTLSNTNGSASAHTLCVTRPRYLNNINLTGPLPKEWSSMVNLGSM
jgi:hypothetical protein